MAGNSESRFVVCEDAEQVAKIVAVRDELPKLEAIVCDRAEAEGALSLDELRERGRGRDAGEIAARVAARQARGPVHDHLHVGHDRPAQGLRAHARQLPPGHPHVRGDRRHRGGRARLPLPAARALLRAADPAAVRGPRRAADLLERRPAADRAGPDGDQAGLPAVGPADLREDLHARHVQQRSREDRRGDAARAAPCGGCGRPGQEVPEPLQAAFDKADAELFVNVRNIFGGNLKQATSGAAPIAHGDPRVLLRLRRARARGLRDDRDLDGLDHLDRRRPPARHGRPRAPGRRDQDRRRRRDPRPRPAHLPAATTAPATRPRSAR